MNPVLQLLLDLLAGPVEDGWARLAALDDAQLAEFESVATATFDAIRSGGDLPEGVELPAEADAFETLERVVDAVDAVREDAGARMAAAEADAQRLDSLADRLHPTGETQPGDDGSGDGADPGDGEGTQAPEGDPAPAGDPEPAPEGDPAGQPEGATEPVAVPAAARPRVPLARLQSRVPAPQRPRPRQDGPVSVMTAAADVPGYGAGAPLRSLEELAEVMVARADSLRGVELPEGKEVRLHAARITASYGEDRMLDRNAIANEERITAALGEGNQTIVSMRAAGGLCAPPTPLYDQITIAADDRPGRGALPSFGATRGGILFMPPPRLGDYLGGTRKWTVANDVSALTDANVRKPCVRIDCDDTVEEQVYARTSCLELGNFFARTYDERVQAVMRLMAAEQAREAERDLLDKIGSESTDIPMGQVLGTTRDVLAHLDLLVASFRNRHRVPDGFMLEFWLPRWLRDNMRADLARALASSGGSLQENLAAADAEIAAFFVRRNVAVTWIWDGERSSGQDFPAIEDGIPISWPTRVIGYLFHPGAWMFLDMGRLDLGVVRDSTLNATNDLQIFAESWEGAAFRGLESIRVTMDICPDGSQSGTVDINPCDTGS